MNLNQVFYSIATCCLLMTIFFVSEVFGYLGKTPRQMACYRRYMDCRSYSTTNSTTNIYDFRNKQVKVDIEDVKNSSIPVILFNDRTVFPEDFIFSDMLCNQLNNNNGEILCFYPKL